MDFYLQSHAALKGTAKPAHYFVLQNEMRMPSADIQMLAHRLCYSYVRATVGVSYASPAYYADRLCERGRCYLRRFFNPSQLDKDNFNNDKSAFENTLKAKREKLFPNSGKKKNNKGHFIKTEQEREWEKKERKAWETGRRKQMLKQANDHLFQNPKKDNGLYPWHGNVAGTMFWM
jgi:eukaryotic translation initiation factor 2C